MASRAKPLGGAAVGDGLKLGEMVYCLGHVCACKGQGGISSSLGPCPPQSRPSPLATQCRRTFFLDGRLSTWRCIGYTFPAHCFCARPFPAAWFDQLAEQERNKEPGTTPRSIRLWVRLDNGRPRAGAGRLMPQTIVLGQPLRRLAQACCRAKRTQMA
ncbi:hypothetical protein GGP41_004859 [Bipolaris sorokiniana]|uniref:Uncharacterized protein n=1 Tax=Cochliobolus sativus TaxID=45130 RepID=A0A8H6DSX8_COCSA|nr:hypothetical protein GGP41_004859 [Bipolaris sorokiniana]